ncbi:MAG: hypothetical protein JWP76_3725 [Dactylosporangium sp.]|jgi:hypothetical protein|nr:hypothetical protein [Dactylosporangium sp.]
MTSYRIAAVAAVSSANAALSALAYASPLVSAPSRGGGRVEGKASRRSEDSARDFDAESQQRR